jgi:hypothetical protein
MKKKRLRIRKKTDNKKRALKGSAQNKNIQVILCNFVA